MTNLLCRFCETPLSRVFADLGMSPLSNAYLRAEQLHEMEPFYPLTAYVCEGCLLVQLPAVETPEHIFSDYAYFSSYSTSWLEHARRYAEAMIDRLGLSDQSQVIEIASNDGYLLKNFVARRIPVLGIEPAANVAAVAEAAGVPTLVRFFGRETAQHLVARGICADLLAGNNVLAHVPDLNDFVAGMALLLKPKGVVTMEFPHLLTLIEQIQFDTIYHEHFSYFSLLAVEKVFAAHGLTIFDVELLPTHGGSLRIFASHSVAAPTASPRLVATREKECAAGLNAVETYDRFAQRVQETKGALLQFLLSARSEGKQVVGYGAPAKGNTLLNYCGVRRDFLAYTVDRSPHKQGLFLPGTHIPIYTPEKIAKTRPDYVMILPWNLKDEIIEQMAHVRQWGGKFVIPIPRAEVVE